MFVVDVEEVVVVAAAVVYSTLPVQHSHSGYKGHRLKGYQSSSSLRYSPTEKLQTSQKDEGRQETRISSTGYVAASANVRRRRKRAVESDLVTKAWSFVCF